MSADEFQTRYAAIMASVLESAIAETTKLFETMVDELKAEISRIKKENEDLKTKCSKFESAWSRATVDTRGSEPLPGRSDASEKRDTAVQCDLVPFCTMLVEQCQPLRHSSVQNQTQQCGYEGMEYALQEHNYDTLQEENSQMAFVLVKQESVLKQEEVESPVVFGEVLNDKADSPWTSAYGIENERPFMKKVCSTGEIPVPQRHEENQDTTYSGLEGVQNQSSELEHSLVVSLAAIKDGMEEESDVGLKILEIGTHGELITSEKHSLVVAQHQSEVEPLDKVQPLNKAKHLQQPVKEILQSPSSDVPTEQEVKKSPASMEEVEVSSADGTVDIPSFESPEACPVQPKESSSIITPSVQESANIALEDVEKSKIDSLAVSVASLSREKVKPSESQQLSMDVEESTIQSPSTKVSSAGETLNNPPVELPQAPSVQPSEQTSVTIQDALLLVEAMNQSIVENTFSSLQREPAPPQTLCAPEVGTLQTVDKVPAEPQMLPLPVETPTAIGKLPITELSRTTQSTTEELPALPQTKDTTPTNEAQAHMKVAVLKQQHAVSLSDSATSSMPSSTAAAQTHVQSLLQRCPHPPTTLVTPSKRGKAVPHKIIVVPKSVSSLIPHQTATQSSTQPPAVMSTVTAALNSNTLPGCTAASSPLGLCSLSSVLQKKIYVASSKSFPVVTKSTATSADPGTLLHPKITIIIPRQVSAVASRRHQSQTSVLTAKQESAKSAAPVVESQELSVSVDKQSALDEVATIWSQKRDDTLGNLESPKQTASKTNVNTENCCSLNLSVGQVPISMSPDVPPTFEQKRSAVVRLTRLPLSVSTEESVFVSRLPTNGSPDSQSILKEDTTQETPSSVVISTQPSETPVLSTDICPNSKETSGVPVYTSRMSKEPNAIQERTSLSSENGTTFDESPNSGNVQSSTSSVVSQPVFEKSISDITTTKPSAVSGAEVEPSNLDEKIISIAVQDCSLPNDGPTQEKQSADLIHFTSIASKDTSDPHVQMTKTQFLAQLAVSPVAQYPEQASSDDSVDTRASCAETSASDKKRLQKNSLIAQLRSHLKTHMQVRRTETNPEPCTETEAHTVSPKKPRLENGHSNNINTTSEPIPISPKNTSGEVRDITSLKETTNNPTAISPRRSGLCKVGVKLKRTVNETSSVSSRGSKASSESIPASPRSPSSGRDGVVSITKKSPAMSRRSFTSVEEISSPKNTKTPSVSPRRTTSTTDGTIPKYTKTGGSPNKSKTTSARPKRTSSSRDGASPEKTKSTSVSPRTSGLSKNGTAPKMSTNESTSVSRRRCTFTKGVSITKQIKRESISLSPRRCSTTTDHASTINAKSETSSPNVRWPKLAKNGVSPKKTEESTSAKPRLIHDHTGPKKNLRVVNAKTLAKAAKAKTIAKMKNSNQSKLQNRAKTSQLAENRSNCEAVKKCTAKAVWIPPRMPVSKTPPAKGQGSVQVPMKKETTSPTSQDHEVVYPPSVSLHPIPVKAPPIVSPLQPLSVIGRHLLKNQCGECGRVFSSSDALESHVSLHTSRRPFSCKLCGKRFLDSKGLKRHGRVHRNGRIHICQQCGKGFVYRFGLTKHIQMVHSRIKPFVCQICNKGFVIKRDVEAHIRMHTGEKPFHCNLCEKKFARRVELNVHLRWHNGEKRHWCPYCGKGFLDLNNLKRHKYIHTGEKPHSCPHCPKRFTQSGHLKKHVKNVHKIQ